MSVREWVWRGGMPESGLHGVSVISDLAEDAQDWPMRDRTKGTCRNPCSRIRYSADPIFSPFVILIFSTVMLVILVVGSIALLTTVGETKLPSTLTLAVGPTKRD
jgi:hypothetical protein